MELPCKERRCHGARSTPARCYATPMLLKSWQCMIAPVLGGKPMGPRCPHEEAIRAGLSPADRPAQDSGGRLSQRGRDPGVLRL